MIRILHLADLHLGRSHSYLGERAAERRQEADGLLRRIVDRVLGDPIEVDAVVIAGDLFESYRPDGGLVGEVIGQLGRLVDAGKTVITLPGNHDELSYAECVYNRHRGRWPGILVTCPGWTRVATVRTGDGACHFYGIAYQAGITPEGLETDLPLEADGMHVALLHASVDLPGKDRAIQARSQELGDLGVHYVALGHVHKARTIPIPGGLAVFPGLIEGSGFDDPGRGELVIVTLGGGTPELETVPVDTRAIRTVEIDLGSIEDGAALRSAVQNLADPGLILRIRLTGIAGFEPPTALLAGELGDRFHHLELVEEFTRIGAAEVEAAAGDETVLGLVLRALKAKEAGAESERERAMLRLAVRHVWHAFQGGRVHG
jgi:exonuclease SbcD